MTAKLEDAGCRSDVTYSRSAMAAHRATDLHNVARGQPWHYSWPLGLLRPARKRKIYKQAASNSPQAVLNADLAGRRTSSGAQLNRGSPNASAIWLCTLHPAGVAEVEAVALTNVDA